ncbi:MAG: asparaginase domain-containing protein [Lysobacterales bacterium]
MDMTFIATGGTIDKIYFDAKSDYQIGDPQIGEILHAFNVALTFDLVALMRKDSLELNDADRQLIVDTVMEHPGNRFVITHGTDTMVQTAIALAPAAVDNTVVLTGALNPARFIGSDAVFNIGCAVAACQTLESGVHLAMNGRIWNPSLVRKNRDANRFEAIDSA